MRKIININDNWKFTKQGETQTVNLPHSWNSIDGQKQADYFRGECVYERELTGTNGTTYLEFNGANSVCRVLVNGNEAGSHRGGYSVFRFDVTPYLSQSTNIVKVFVDNSDFEDVYPTMADFTFYGGLYRDVNVITDIDELHFSLDTGECGVLAAPSVNGDGAGVIALRAFVKGATDGDTLTYTVKDAEGNDVKQYTVPATQKHASVTVENAHLWNGMKDPYLYTLECTLQREGKVTDEVSFRIGFRTVAFTADKGCFLNGEHIKLQGVSRHQDREWMGNALTEKEHREDLELIKEVGANSIRLAHYQHDRKFYNICDEMGFLVWAEVPVISRFSAKKQKNAKQQLTELITQNFNHASIFCWGVENEITIGGKAKGVESGVRELNMLAKDLDPTRPTTAAQVMMCGMDSKMNTITDILGYNHYFGWYAQTYHALDRWLDEFHKQNPEIKLCLSEYGAEGIVKYQNDKPQQGDYSEAYQAELHEHYVKAITEREWLWGSYVWNMFDFGAANRDEGGVKGRNNKGLITMDRKIKKDSFYAYKSYWCEEPFVHIGGERYIDRPVGTTTIKVYTNEPSVKLTVNGTEYTSEGERVAVFKDVPVIAGENVAHAVTEHSEHSIKFNGVNEPNPDYVLPCDSHSMVRNWFTNDATDGINPAYFSVNDKVGELLKNAEVKELIEHYAGNKIPKFLFTILKPFKVSSLVKLARMDSGMVSIANQYLQTIKK